MFSFGFIVSRFRLYDPGRSGAYARNRTGDLILTKDALYQLSYVGITSSRMKLKRKAPVSKRNGKIIYHGFREMQALFSFFSGFFSDFLCRAGQIRKNESPVSVVSTQSRIGWLQGLTFVRRKSRIPQRGEEIRFIGSSQAGKKLFFAGRRETLKKPGPREGTRAKY